MNDTTPSSGPALFISIMGTLFAWITVKDFQIILTVIATMVSIVAGLLVCYQNYLKIKKDKQE